MEELLRRQQEAKNQELQESIRRAQEALQNKWETEGQEARETYCLDLPKQSVKIANKEKAKQAILTLKSFGIRGTYRVSLEGGSNGNN